MSRDLKQKPEDDLNFFVNYWNHCHAVKDKHQELLKDVEVSTFLKTATSIAATKLNFFSQLRDGYDYLDEILGVIVIPVVCVGMATIALLTTTLNVMHMLAITMNIANANKEINPGLEALDYLILSIAFPLIAVASLVKCAISMITRPLITLVQGVQAFDDEDENRFSVAHPPLPASLTSVRY